MNINKGIECLCLDVIGPKTLQFFAEKLMRGIEFVCAALVCSMTNDI